MTRRHASHSPHRPPKEAAFSCPLKPKEKPVTDSIVSDLVALLDEDLREAYEERAAIVEFDGGVDRVSAVLRSRAYSAVRTRLRFSGSSRLAPVMS